MKSYQTKTNNNSNSNNHNFVGSNNHHKSNSFDNYSNLHRNHSNHHHHQLNGFLPNSLKFISSCIKTASSGIKTASSGVRSASASVAASISGDSHELKDQVLWASYDRIELSPSSFKRVLLLGYLSGFQVLDVEDGSNVLELVSRRGDPVTFLRMQPLPAKSEGHEGFWTSHPLLSVVACDESKSSGHVQNGRENLVRDGYYEAQNGNSVLSPMAVRFYSLRSHNYVHVLRFRSTVYMVRSSPRIVAVGLAAQIYCFDALTLENKFSVLTYPVPQLGGHGTIGYNVGYGPMDVGPRWLAYAPNSPLMSNTGRLSPKSLTPSPGVSPSTSPSSGSLMARYAMESGKQLAAGLINLGDMGYKTLSRYYQEGSSSPVSSNSGWKAVRAHSLSTEADTAGMVVVKDVVSRAIISQFRAHSSAISALCFDPSGTLLVTASVHGNNINIFRIMPSNSKTGSSSESHDWSSSHVHLYKLHRGMTSAVIQDICFSPYSQWIAIVSSKGTCHVFLLSPFGGECLLQVQNSHVGQPTLAPVLSLPWWSTASFMINQHSSAMPPPAPVTLHVVSRLKNCNTGLLNTVSNAASSAIGKVSVPSGAVATVFHRSLRQNVQHPPYLKPHALESLLVYTPSGHVVQYELLPSVGGESSENVSRSAPASSLQMPDEELRVKVEPLQWWDVCRRTDWPEREECISGIIFDRKEAAEILVNGSVSEDSYSENKELERSCERSHLYLANAEVQMGFGRVPIWQQSKIYFFTMSSLRVEEQKLLEDDYAGEFEIEKVSVQEIEIRRKDLLPVFDHFHRYQYGWSERGPLSRVHSSSCSSMAGEKSSEDGLISYPKLDSSVEDSDHGSYQNSYLPNVHGGHENNVENRGYSGLLPAPLKQSPAMEDAFSISSKQYMLGFPAEDCTLSTSAPTLIRGSLSAQIMRKDFQVSNSGGPSEASNTSSNHSSSSMNAIDEETVNRPLDFEQYFQEEYCQASPMDEGHDPLKPVLDPDGSSPRGREKSEEDGDNDNMLGVFAFSEED